MQILSFILIQDIYSEDIYFKKFEIFEQTHTKRLQMLSSRK